jgi:hypothetical protein
MSEENGTTPEQPPQQGQAMQLGIQITPQGVVLTFPVNLALDNATMAQLIKAYLQAHPEVAQELVREIKAQQQRELTIIRHVNSTKNNN